MQFEDPGTEMKVARSRLEMVSFKAKCSIDSSKEAWSGRSREKHAQKQTLGCV